jgi:hypothetical protein
MMWVAKVRMMMMSVHMDSSLLVKVGETAFCGKRVLIDRDIYGAEPGRFRKADEANLERPLV